MGDGKENDGLKATYSRRVSEFALNLKVLDEYVPAIDLAFILSLMSQTTVLLVACDIENSAILSVPTDLRSRKLTKPFSMERRFLRLTAI